jgi:hypothetical protein
MGTTLTGTTPQDTYDSLIKVTDNGPLTGSLKTLTDGLGNDSALALSTGAARVTGTLAVTTGTISGTDAIAISAVNTNTNGTTFALNSAGTVGIMTFLTASTERMRITSAGNVGIGTDAPTSLLHARRAGNGNVLTVANDQTISQVNIGVGVVTASRPFLGTNNDSNPLEVGTQAPSDMIFLRNSTEIARITANGLTFNGDTAAANALDDYEEGTWTMGVSFGGASVDVTTSSNTGTYTKIGRQVTVNGYIVLTNKGSSVGTARITGLPFTIAFSDSNYNAATLRLDAVTFANQFQSYGVINATTIELEEITEAGTRTKLTDADFANNSSIMVSLTYFV